MALSKITDASVTNSTLTTTKLATPNLGRRNRIINGAMTIDQRNAGASVTPNNTYTVDRWQIYNSQTSKLTVQQNAGSVTLPAGFNNYLGITSSSAYSVLAADLFTLHQIIEGFNWSDMGFGTANAATVTLSFRVYSSLTGTFGGSLRNYSGTRGYPFTYSIPVANTWTTISVTIAGDTSGTWVGATDAGCIYVFFGLGVGATRSGTAGSWAAADYRSATGATSVVGTSGATFYITGVQLEANPEATPFEHRSYGEELALCQRYFSIFPSFSGPANQSTALRGFGSYVVSMRSFPTLAVTGAMNVTDGYSSDITQSSGNIVTISQDERQSFFHMGNFSGVTVGRIYFGPRRQNNSNITLDAELQV